MSYTKSSESNYSKERNDSHRYIIACYHKNGNNYFHALTSNIIYYTDNFVYNDKGFSFAKGKLWTDLSTIDASRLQVYPASGRYLGEYCPWITMIQPLGMITYRLTEGRIYNKYTTTIIIIITHTAFAYN